MTEPTFDQRTGTDEAPAPEPTPASVSEPDSPGFNYYVHLANGDVVTTVNEPSGSRWTENGQDVLIIGVYPR